MNYKLHNALVAAAFTGLVVLAVLGYTVQRSQGSVITGQAYNATTSLSTSAGTYWQARSTSNVGGCELGSVVVASSSATRFRLWNATSTTDVASTTIVNFDEVLDTGTYIFDLQCTRGLIVETPAGFDGNYIVTWR